MIIIDDEMMKYRGPRPSKTRAVMYAIGIATYFAVFSKTIFPASKPWLVQVNAVLFTYILSLIALTILIPAFLTGIRRVSHVFEHTVYACISFVGFFVTMNASSNAAAVSSQLNALVQLVGPTMWLLNACIQLMVAMYIGASLHADILDEKRLEEAGAARARDASQ